MDNIDKVNNDNTGFILWAQNFSKKIVTIFSILYVIIIIVMVTMLTFELRIGFTDGVSTMISEINETFRIVIGGYLIKAAVENGFKITGTYLAGINKAKLVANSDLSTDEVETAFEEGVDEI